MTYGAGSPAALATARYRERRGVKQAQIQVTPEDMAALDAYAAALGLPRATMMRRCIARCMIADGYDPKTGKPAEGRAEDHEGDAPAP
ncbi:hypothetical protein [Hominenteromicrobium sp.]|uniref:hypothetical protein n=1 Tax=Hominenteromicrobium sp. TaxID=3073581 RepID=UPI003A923465